MPRARRLSTSGSPRASGPNPAEPHRARGLGMARSPPTLADVQVCPNCGEENPPKFRLCGFCGTPLAPVAPPQEVRKLVTILFCDLKGSTSLGESLDSESLRETMRSTSTR
jgi:zinc ribbon protein